MSDKRLLILIHSLRGGGAGRMCAFLANGMAQRGWYVTVAVTLADEGAWRRQFSADVHVVHLKRRHARRALVPLIRVVRQARPGVVVAFNYQVAVMLPVIRRLAGVPFRAVGRTVVALSAAAEFKGFWQREVVMRAVRRRYRRLDAVIAQSEDMRPDLETNFGVVPERIHVIHNPAVSPGPPGPPGESKVVTDPELSSTSGETPTPATPAPPTTPLGRKRVLLYLGRFKPQKQPFQMLDLLGRLDTSVSLVAAGEGPLVDSFLEQAATRGVRDRIDYRGYVSNLEPLFAAADVTILMSAYEGFPNVLVESIARGIPVVSYDCPTGPAEIIRTGENGALVPLNDVSAFAAAVVGVLEQPPRREAVQATAERFHPETILDRYEEVLRG